MLTTNAKHVCHLCAWTNHPCHNRYQGGAQGKCLERNYLTRCWRCYFLCVLLCPAANRMILETSRLLTYSKSIAFRGIVLFTIQPGHNSPAYNSGSAAMCHNMSDTHFAQPGFAQGATRGGALSIMQKHNPEAARAHMVSTHLWKNV